MPDRIDGLIAEVGGVRAQVLRRAGALSPGVARWSPAAGVWSTAEIVEHLVRAEGFGLRGLWREAEAVREGSGQPIVGPAEAARTIDEVFAELPDRVEAPDAVLPTAGGRPLGYWLARLDAHQLELVRLGAELREVGPARVTLPHYVAGPLDGWQRLGFFRWHLERHLAQIGRLLGRR